jgi:hypothetical protein
MPEGLSRVATCVVLATFDAPVEVRHWLMRMAAVRKGPGERGNKI